MNLEHCLLLILLNSDFFLPLPKQLILDQLVYIDVLVAVMTIVLHRFVLGIEQLVLSTADTVHKLLVLH